jgi:hypothetical protein
VAGNAILVVRLAIARSRLESDIRQIQALTTTPHCVPAAVH